MNIAESFIAELEHEGAVTRRFLEQIPADQLTWRAHPRSNTVGWTGLHIAQIPAGLTGLAKVSEFDGSSGPPSFPEPQSKAQILKTHDEGLPIAIANLRGFSEADYLAPWTMTFKGRVVMRVPRVAMVRSFVFSHLIQHRGQLGVYLRLLGCKVPSSYGPSADENPMG